MTARRDEHFDELQLLASRKKEYAPPPPPGPRRKEGEDNGLNNDPTVNGWISNGLTIFGCVSENGMSVSRCECGRRLQSEKGLKIHQAKLKCEGEVEKQRAGAAAHSGKTPNDT